MYISRTMVGENDVEFKVTNSCARCYIVHTFSAMLYSGCLDTYIHIYRGWVACLFIISASVRYGFPKRKEPHFFQLNCVYVGCICVCVIFTSVCGV